MKFFAALLFIALIFTVGDSHAHEIVHPTKTLQERKELYKACKDIKPAEVAEIKYTNTTMPSKISNADRQDYLIEMNRLYRGTVFYNMLLPDNTIMEEWMAENEPCEKPQYKDGYMVGQEIPGTQAASGFVWMPAGEIYALPSDKSPVVAITKAPEVAEIKRSYGDWKFVGAYNTHGWVSGGLREISSDQAPVPADQKIMPFADWKIKHDLDVKIKKLEKAKDESSTALEQTRKELCQNDFTEAEMDDLIPWEEQENIDSNTWGSGRRAQLAELCGVSSEPEQAVALKSVKLITKTCNCYSGAPMEGVSDKVTIKSEEEFSKGNECWKMKYHVMCKTSEGAGEGDMGTLMACPLSCLEIK